MNKLRSIPPILVWTGGVIVALLSILGAFLPWCAVVAGLLTILIVTVQYRNQGSTAVAFKVQDWVKGKDSYQFTAGLQHGKGKKPNVAVYERASHGGYEEVFCDVKTLESGDVLLYVSTAFDGEVRIS